MIKKEINIMKLQGFKNLKENWNDYGAPPISHSLIDTAIKIIQEIKVQPQLFPTARNSIQLEYEKINGEYLEFELFEDKIEMYIEAQFEKDEKAFLYNEIDFNKYIDEFLRD